MRTRSRVSRSSRRTDPSRRVWACRAWAVRMVDTGRSIRMRNVRFLVFFFYLAFSLRVNGVTMRTALNVVLASKFLCATWRRVFHVLCAFVCSFVEVAPPAYHPLPGHLVSERACCPRRLGVVGCVDEARKRAFVQYHTDDERLLRGEGVEAVPVCVTSHTRTHNR